MAKKKPNKDAPVQAEAKTKTGKQYNIWIDRTLRDALDAYTAAQASEPTDTAVFTAALRAFLREQGFWPPKSDSRQ